MDSAVGLLPAQWIALIRTNGIPYKPKFFLRALILSALALRNAQFRKRETSLESLTHQIKIHPPLFIVGHWRSGTTFLHNLLSRDPRFTYPKTYQVRNPNTFLYIGQRFQDHLENREAYKRAMDNVHSSLQAPAEDEFALAAMTLTSPLIGWLFPKNQKKYDAYTLIEENNADVLSAWQNHYLRFYRKIQYMNPDKIILSKSPLNTPRLHLLQTLFPGARFIHIHRNPSDVYRSTEHLYKTAVSRSAIQKITYNIPNRILNRYRDIYTPYLQQKKEIDENHLIEIAFADLERDPMGVLQKIYTQLQLGDISACEEYFSAYLKKLNHKKNAYKPLDSSIRRRIKEHWEPIYREWNYTI